MLLLLLLLLLVLVVVAVFNDNASVGTTNSRKIKIFVDVVTTVAAPIVSQEFEFS
jgi:hypothetical protein